MTEVRWTLPAHNDLLGIISWIAASNPAAAARVGRRVLAAVQRLAKMPFRGRVGRAASTRELVVPGLPYLVIYSVVPEGPRSQIVAILRVLHGALQWPPAENDLPE